MTLCHIYNSTGEELSRFSTTTFEATGRVSIGRSSHCDISLKAFAQGYISRIHFLLTYSFGEWFIVDRSHIGVHFNGEKIKERKMEDGDIYRFGQLFFAFGEKAGPSAYDLVWTNEEGDNRRQVVWPGVNTVGYSADNYITIREGNIARKHGLLSCSDDCLQYTNASSRVSSYVNGRNVIDTVVLSDGDELSLADFPVSIVRAERKDTYVEHAVFGEMSEYGKRMQMSDEEILHHIQEEKRRSIVPQLLLIGAAAILGAMLFLIWLATKVEG